MGSFDALDVAKLEGYCDTAKSNDNNCEIQQACKEARNLEECACTDFIANGFKCQVVLEVTTTTTLDESSNQDGSSTSQPPDLTWVYVIIIIISILVVAGCVVAAVWCFVIKRKRKKANKVEPEPAEGPKTRTEDHV